MKKIIVRFIYYLLDIFYIRIDRKFILRSNNIKLIPNTPYRTGGKVSYAEWAHVIGIFQTIIFQNLRKKQTRNILDIGCGTGILGVATKSIIQDKDCYTGLDILRENIDFCNKHYNFPNLRFIHFDYSNSHYIKTQNLELNPWPIENESQNLVTALSVWTHLNEEDAIYYFDEIYRVLIHGGRAIITFFYLDDLYINTLKKREDFVGKYHATNQLYWKFDQFTSGSKYWLSPKWVKTPEDAIGITVEGINKLIEKSKLKLIKYYPGNWKEQPGVFFQDILIFEKK